MRCGGFVARPVRGFRPRGRVTSLGAQRSNQENRPESAAPRCARGSLRFSVTEARAKLPPLRSGQTVARSQSTKRAGARASAPCDARRLQRGEAKQPTANNPTQQPAKAGCLVFGIGVSGTPLLNRREAQKPRARAKLASRTDSRRLFERSERSERSEFGAALGFEHRREPARRVGGFAGATSLPTFLFAQESRSPAGANSRHHSQHPPTGAQT